LGGGGVRVPRAGGSSSSAVRATGGGIGSVRSASAGSPGAGSPSETSSCAGTGTSICRDFFLPFAGGAGSVDPAAGAGSAMLISPLAASAGTTGA
jgi:hypothetical protein